MRHRLSRPQGPLWDALELVAYVVLLCAAALLLWFWEEFTGLSEFKVAGCVVAVFALIGLVILSIHHLLRLLGLTLESILHVLCLIRKARREWRRTFRPRPKHRQRPRGRTRA